MKSTEIPNRSKVFRISVPKIKGRKRFSLAQRPFEDRRAYDRNNFKKGIYE